MQKQGYVYILTNKNHTVLYTGVTSNLEGRIYQHKHKLIDGFAKKNNCSELVWWQVAESMIAAIEREKQIKAGSRKRKELLITEMNPQWVDLAASIFGET